MVFRKMDPRVLPFVLTLVLLLGWSGVAQSQEPKNGFGYYTVHATTARVNLAFEECNGECRVHYQKLNSPRLVRLLCGMDDNERIPAGFTLATFIACQEYPNAMIGVWDRINEEHICNSLDLGVISAAHQYSGPNRGKAELLLGADEGFPLMVSALAHAGPLPRKFEMDEMCWLRYRTSAISGALSPDSVITGGHFRAGSPIAIYGDF